MFAQLWIILSVAKQWRPGEGFGDVINKCSHTTRHMPAEIDRMDCFKVAEKARRAAQQKLVAETVREPGCRRYELNQSLDDARVLIFTEKWASEHE